MAKSPLDWKKWYDSPEFREQYQYDGNLGAFCGSKGTRVLLWSPAAEEAVLSLYRDDGSDPSCAAPSFASCKMERLSHGVWMYETDRNLDGIYYDFTLTREGKKTVTADPYARACGANGLRSMFVDLSRTDPEDWEGDLPPALTQEQIIYELHVKEFSWDAGGGFPESVRGKYLAFTCPNTTLNNDGLHPTGIRYLQLLGITHVQLMPFFDFGSVDETAIDPDSQFNWGYDPVNYNVPEGSYASDAHDGAVRIRECKQMIQALHRAGFRVVMDVVYNHTWSLDSSLQKTVPWYYYRLNPDGSVSNGSCCGNDTASERPMCAAYILDSVLYWAREYHIDGFRFDLMGLLTTDLINCIQTRLDDLYGKGEKLIYGEPWAGGPTAMEGGFRPASKAFFSELNPSVGMFSDDTRDTIKGSVFDVKAPGFANGAAGLEGRILRAVTAWASDQDIPVNAPSQVITYVSSHDNQTLLDKLSETTSDPVLRMRQYRLAAGIYLTCQGRPFLLSGEEFARTKNGLTDSYHAPVSLNRLDWNLPYLHADLVSWYRGLFRFRSLMPGLWDKSAAARARLKGAPVLSEGIVAFCLDNTSHDRGSNVSARWNSLFIIYNARRDSADIPLPPGAWELLIDGESSSLWETSESFRHLQGSLTAPPVSLTVLGESHRQNIPDPV